MQSLVVRLERCVACKSCEIACAVHRGSLAKRLPEAIFETPAPLARVRVEDTGAEQGFPVQCRHCEDAPCLDACPSGALHRHAEGLVLVHDDRCIGCWMCVMVCPFGAPRPFGISKKMIKCDRCTGMDGPFCVDSCPTGALVLMDPQEVAQERRRAYAAALAPALHSVSPHRLTTPPPE
jgi:carbon-monoxide dehydrogenase iron sulfur subunit